MSKRRRAKSLTNRHVGECFRCQIRIPENEGTFFKGPLRLVCAACVLREGVRDDNGFAMRLAQLPRKTQDGRMLQLMEFQEEDCKRIATTKALLIGSQMGTGKTVQAAMAALRIDAPNLIFCPASVRENWVDEIARWRPDLRVEPCLSQVGFRDEVLALLRSPGRVMVCSFGVLPGSPCRGCRGLRARLKQLRKWKREMCPACDQENQGTVKVEGQCLGCGGQTMKIESPRYHASWYPQCSHYPGPDGAEQLHPPFVDLRIDKRNLRLPYHPPSDVEAWIASGVELPARGKTPGFDQLAPGIEHNGCFKQGTAEKGGCEQVNPLPDVDRSIVLLADECHAFKNPGNGRTRNWRALRDRVWAASGSVFGLSGTPCEGKPMEFWEVLRSLGLEKASFGTWENYHRIFKHWFENPKGSRVPPQGELRKELHSRLRRIQINRRRKDVLSQLPPRQEQVIYVDINEKTINEVNEAVHKMLAVKRAWDDVQKGALYNGRRMQNPFEPRLDPDEKQRRRLIYNAQVEHYFRDRPWHMDEEIVEAVDEALMSKGQMPTIDQLSRIRAMLSKAKVHAVTEWLKDREEECEPVVLFSQHVSILKKIATRPGWECFHGGLTGKKRSEMVKRFQSGEIERGLCVSIGAGGEGITLTRAAICAEIDLSWNPAKNHQAESRLIRIGAEQHHDAAAEKARRLALSGECVGCKVEDDGAVTPCAEHQARILVVRFVARHIVDELVMTTLKEKESLLASLEWEEEEQA
jgi:hypothetical protein